MKSDDKIFPEIFCEVLVNLYQTTRCHIPEYSNRHAFWTGVTVYRLYSQPAGKLPVIVKHLPKKQKEIIPLKSTFKFEIINIRFFCVNYIKAL